jgi:hypothetical protein
MFPDDASLPPATETGSLGIWQLKRLWARNRAGRSGHRLPVDLGEKHLDHLVIDAVGVGLEQTIQHLFAAAPSFAEFERWIVATAGPIAPLQAARINAAVTGSPSPAEIADWLAAVDASPPVLSAGDLAFWQEHGYVVVHDAVPADSLAAAPAISSSGTTPCRTAAAPTAVALRASFQYIRMYPARMGQVRTVVATRVMRPLPGLSCV